MVEALTILSEVIGWIYFFAWSISFYGQFYTNWKLKSVEGYKLDFQVLNFTGFAFYSYIYIIGYFWQDTNPYDNYGLGEIQIQDLLFAVHAFILVCIIGVQCFIYPRGKNEVSKPAWCLVAFYWVAVPAVYCFFRVFNWWQEDRGFNFVMLVGEFKLSISVIKYIPPAWWNYKRKSTLGWSMENIMLDFTGGLFSVLQTLINLANNDSQVINPIKFTLGNVSMAFDILFMIQHFILYRNNRHAPVNNSDVDNDDNNRPARQYVNFNNDDESHYRNSGNAYHA
jgi:cystinosin